MAEFIAIGLQLPEASSRKAASPDQPFTDAPRPRLQGKTISAQNSWHMDFSSFREFERLLQRKFTSFFHKTIQSLLSEKKALINSTLI